LDRTERFYRIQQLLERRLSVSSDEFRSQLQVSRATLHRDIEYLRDRMGMPIVWDAGVRAYRLKRSGQGTERFHLPGLWLTEAEISGLVAMGDLIDQVDPSGVIGAHIKPLRDRLYEILTSMGIQPGEFSRRIRWVSLGSRAGAHLHFPKVALATLTRRRIVIDYYTRGRDERQEREVSPQRIVHYRQNWYLDAWCHLRGGLRSFALDCILGVEATEVAAQEISDVELDEFFSKGYGMFSGAHPLQWAVLRFTPERSRWVGNECWHLQQQSEFSSLGEYILRVPYTMCEELIGDILRHGTEVEVVSPPSLRSKVREAHLSAGLRYPG
jgi:predicted DNA-binding transcriptional regulator YafY